MMEAIRALDTLKLNVENISESLSNTINVVNQMPKMEHLSASVEPISQDVAAKEAQWQ